MFTRNKRDMCFQVYPRVAFDARNDYQSALKFFDKSFGEAEDEEDMGNTAAAEQEANKPAEGEPVEEEKKENAAEGAEDDVILAADQEQKPEVEEQPKENDVFLLDDNNIELLSDGNFVGNQANAKNLKSDNKNIARDRENYKKKL